MPVHQYGTRRAMALRAQTPVQPQPRSSSFMQTEQQKVDENEKQRSSPVILLTMSEKGEAAVDMKEEHLRITSRKRIRSEAENANEKDMSQEKLEDDSDNESLFSQVALSPLLSSEPSSPLNFSSSSTPTHPFSLSNANSPRSRPPSPFPSSDSSSPSLAAYFLGEMHELHSSPAAVQDSDEDGKPPRKRPRLYIHIPEDDVPSAWSQKYPTLMEDSKAEKKVEFAGLPCFDEEQQNNAGDGKSDETRTQLIGPYSVTDYQDNNSNSHPHALHEECEPSLPSLPVDNPHASLPFTSHSTSSAASSVSATANDIFSQFDWVIAASIPPVDIISSPFMSSPSSSSSSCASPPLVEEEHSQRFELVCSELEGIECRSWRMKNLSDI